MEINVRKFTEVEFPTDSSDAKYLSTLLVATIEDAKDKISQIEYIFCNQLFPNIEFRSKDLHKWYSEASRAAEDAWKAKEKDLLLQIDELELEKWKILEENQSLKMQKAEHLKIQVGDNGKHLGRQSSLEEKICELEGELRQKSKDVDEGMELQSKLLELIQSNTYAIMNKEKQLRKSEEKSNAILEKSKVLDRKIDMLHKELTEKIEEVVGEKEKQQDLLKTIERQASELSAREQKLNVLEKEKKLVTISLDQSRGTIEGLHEELRKKNKELEEASVLKKQLIEQINLNSSQALQNKIDHENEKKLLEAKVNGLLERVDQLQEKLRGRGNEASCSRESCKNLQECVEQKSFELTAEKNRKQDIIAAYKRLKSQYNFLCSKYGLSVHNTPSQNKIEEENDSLDHIKKLAAPTEFENKISTSSVVTCNMARLKKDIMSPEKLDNQNESKSAQPSMSNSRSTFISPHTSKCLNTVKSVGLSGSKRSASHWRETRSHQNQEGPDPHDDFLDTPFENVRENMNKVMKEEVHLPVPVPKDMNFDCSDDETQDLNTLSMPPKQQMEAPKTTTKGFKYIEPVRKKADRENLKGIECKQCKKFYDAVLPDDGNERNLRCEHHDGVSRHRYKYAPPMTPEGFWNIGFESEM